MSFYEVLAPLSATLLGLWWVVVQVRESRAPGSVWERRLASGMSLHLALPALMSLASLIDPESRSLWRTAFAGLGAVGLAHLAAPGARHGRDVAATGRGAPLALAAAAAVYLGVVGVAVLAGPVDDAGGELRAIEVEGVLLTALLGLQLYVAVRLLFAPPRSPAP